MGATRIGIIGYGSMGSMLARAILRGNLSVQIYLSTRSPERLAGADPRVSILGSNRELASTCDLVFLCVKPIEAKHVLLDIVPALSPEAHLVSIVGGYTRVRLEKLFAGKISLVTPTLVSELGRGVTLACHNSQVSEADRSRLEGLLAPLGLITSLPEGEMELASIVASCGPALFAAMAREFAHAAKQVSSLDAATINAIASETLLGTAKLLTEGGMGFDELIARVATKGGTTEVGVSALARDLPDLFGKMLKEMRARQIERARKIEED
jgi:pyrroline-5-carboxylate reductase